MLRSLTKGLSNVFSKIAGKKSIDANAFESTVRGIRDSLLDSDVYRPDITRYLQLETTHVLILAQLLHYPGIMLSYKRICIFLHKPLNIHCIMMHIEKRHKLFTKILPHIFQQGCF